MTRISARMTRGLVVMLGLLGAGSVLASSMPVWVRGALTDVAGSAPVALTGAAASPGLVPVALAAAAAAFALTLVDGWGRRSVALVLTVCGVAILALVVGVLVDPTASLNTGGSPTSGAGAAGSPVSGSTTLMPWFGLAGGVLVLLAGVAALRAGGGWRSRSARSAAAPAAARERSDWDTLSDGDDPTLG